MAKSNKSSAPNKQPVNAGKIEKPAPIGLEGDQLAALDNWLSARTKWVAAGIFLVSMVLNTVFFSAGKRHPGKIHA